MKALFDFIPLIIFYYLYKTVDPKDSGHPILQWFGASGGVDNNHILVATAGLVISMLVVYGTLFVSQKFRLDKQQWFVLIMTIVFGGFTLVFSDDYYIKLKAVIINIAFALVFFLSPLFIKNKQPLIRKLLDPILDLNQQQWFKLNLAWGGVFTFMAGLHAFFAFVFMQGKYWGDFTAFGDITVMMSFLVLQFYILRKYFKNPDNPSQ